MMKSLSAKILLEALVMLVCMLEKAQSVTACPCLHVRESTKCDCMPMHEDNSNANATKMKML